ncbi:HAMP domain-containing protein, partial [Pseudoxanthomonas sp. SGD-10]
MNEFLQRFTVGKRMFAGFGILLLMMAAIAAVSASSLATVTEHLNSIAGERTAKLRLSNRLIDAANQVYIELQAILLTSDEGERKASQDSIREAREDFARAFEELSALPTRDPGKKLLKAIEEARENAGPVNDEMVRLALAGRQEEAHLHLKEKSLPAIEAWRQAVRNNIARQSETMHEAEQAAYAAARRAQITLFSALAVSILIGILLAYTFTRSLTGPLGRAAAAARDLAAGKLDGAHLAGGADEVGEVLRAIQGTRESVQTVIEAVREMGRQHDQGTISARLDSSVVQGDYSNLMDVVNAVVNEHVQAALTAGRLAGAYARGDLHDDFPRVPGEKAVLMSAMDGVKANLLALSEEIGTLSAAAVHGDFSKRGDEDRFEFGFRDMVANLNR